MHRVMGEKLVQERFLNAVLSKDFDRSNHILYESVRDGRLGEIRTEFVSTLNEVKINLLAMRDHLFRFLGASTIFFALRKTSADILEWMSSLSNPELIRKALFDWILKGYRRDNAIINRNGFDIEMIATTNLSALIPDVISMNERELQNMTIPFSKEDANTGVIRERYYIADIQNTVYGNQILIALGIPDTLDVVSSIEWNRIYHAFKTLGFDIHQSLKEISRDDWFSEIRQMRKSHNSKNTSHPELELLEEALNRYLELDSPNESARIIALKELAKYRISAIQNDVIKLLDSGSKNESLMAVDILASHGGRDATNALQKVLGVPHLRASAATAISKISSALLSLGKAKSEMLPEKEARAFPMISTTSLTDRKELAKLAANSNALVRRDILRTLSHIDDPFAEQLFFSFTNDSVVDLRLGLIELCKNVSSELAHATLSALMLDIDSKVRAKAKLVAEELWPSQDW